MQILALLTRNQILWYSGDCEGPWTYCFKWNQMNFIFFILYYSLKWRSIYVFLNRSFPPNLAIFSQSGHYKYSYERKLMFVKWSHLIFEKESKVSLYLYRTSIYLWKPHYWLKLFPVTDVAHEPLVECWNHFFSVISLLRRTWNLIAQTWNSFT